MRLNGESDGPRRAQERNHRLRHQRSSGRRLRRRFTRPWRVPGAWIGGNARPDLRPTRSGRCRRRRAEHVVHREQRAGAFRDRRQCGDIRHFGKRVGRRLQEKEAGIAPERPLPLPDYGRGNIGGLDAEAAKDAAEQLYRGTEHGIRAHHVVPALEVDHGSGKDRRHARGRGHAALRSFQAANRSWNMDTVGLVKREYTMPLWAAGEARSRLLGVVRRRSSR